MNRALLLWHDYRYFPYEQELAMREAQQVSSKPPEQTKRGVQIILATEPAACRRLTYFREVLLLSSGQRFPTDQARLEASARADRNVSGSPSEKPSGRQSTRYSAHGLHEYKGKFNPQIVRSIGNLLSLDRGSWVLDPFCGSGTTLVESAHSGWNALGIDLNPMAVAIANAKILALRSSSQTLSTARDRALEELRARAQGLEFERSWSERELRSLAGENWKARLPNADYLTAWFPDSVLAQCGLVLEVLSDASIGRLRLVFQVVLSDLLRDASHQEPADLRIRRRRQPLANFPLIPRFIERLGSQVKTVSSAREVVGIPRGSQRAEVGDVRCQRLDRTEKNGTSQLFDAAISSPPYANALPYVDTQRLSLCLLNLVESKGIATLDRALIGSRELGKRDLLRGESEITSQSKGDLPVKVQELCKMLLKEARRPGNGFRRRNVPALTYRYFCDMKRALEQVRGVVKTGGYFALVVGSNRTQLGGKAFSIDTPTLLAETGELAGWKVDEVVPLDTYQRYGIHHKNSIRHEALVILRNR